MLDARICYPALSARDARFDGLFFVGVSTTGVYCRPICPARTPRASRCAFFANAAAAEKAGFRACFRCRPELAPRVRGGVSELVGKAAHAIEAGALSERSLDALAASLGVTARHLRRVMQDELGVSPLELATSHRLATAKQLVRDTALPLTDVAHASGFRSVRRFNDAFRRAFARSPSAFRTSDAGAMHEPLVALHLEGRGPYAWPELIAFLGARAIPDVERIDAGGLSRTLALGGRVGFVQLAYEPHHGTPRVRLALAPALLGVLPALGSRVRSALDLDARPDIVDAHLAHDPMLEPLVRGCPGLRVPGALDPFELAVRAVLGQQVSVAAATTLARRLVARFGEPMRSPRGEAGPRSFPTPATLAHASTSALRAIGLPERRAQTLQALAEVFDLTRDFAGAGREFDVDCMRDVPGIGPWTRAYLAMRAGRDPDAFPASDLVIMRMMGATSPREAERRAEAWRPFRAYAVMHLWRAAAGARTSAATNERTHARTNARTRRS